MKKLLTAFFVFAFAAGCADGRRVDTVMCDVNPFGWLNAAELHFENSDTLSTGDLLLALRCNAGVERQQLPLTIEFTAPDSTRFVESRVFVLPAADGRPTTSGTVTIPYRRAVCFRQQGTYRVSIKPSEVLHGIEAAGFTFEIRNF